MVLPTALYVIFSQISGGDGPVAHQFGGGMTLSGSIHIVILEAGFVNAPWRSNPSGLAKKGQECLICCLVRLPHL